MRPQRVVGQEPVAVKLEAVQGKHQGGHVKLIERGLILAAVEHAQFDRLVRRQFQLALGIELQALLPVRRLDERRIPVRMRTEIAIGHVVPRALTNAAQL